MISSAEIAATAKFAPIKITGGVLADEAMALFEERTWRGERVETAMIVIRAAKIVMVAAIALFATIVAFGNITDYGTNLAFVQHVLSMDTIFERSTIRYRAIKSPALHHVAYAIIIATEAATAVLCWIGACALLRRLRADAPRSIAPRPWRSPA